MNTITEVAEHFGVSLYTVRRWIRLGMPRSGDGFNPDVILDWIKHTPLGKTKILTRKTHTELLYWLELLRPEKSHLLLSYDENTTLTPIRDLAKLFDLTHGQMVCVLKKLGKLGRTQQLSRARRSRISREYYEQQFGPAITDSLVNLEDHPELTGTDVGELLGVSCERVRQIRIQLGKPDSTFKKRLFLKCSPYRYIVGKRFKAVCERLTEEGFEFSILPHNCLSINGHLVRVWTPNLNSTSTWQRYYFRLPKCQSTPDLFIVVLEENLHVVPAPGKLYIRKDIIPDYRNAFHLLL